MREIYSEFRQEYSDRDDAKDSKLTIEVRQVQRVDDALAKYIESIEDSILIFDDLMKITKSNEMISLFSRAYHHNNRCMFHLWQMLFLKQTWAIPISRCGPFKYTDRLHTSSYSTIRRVPRSCCLPYSSRIQSETWRSGR